VVGPASQPRGRGVCRPPCCHASHCGRR
jgi:hypothetical protein